MLLLLFRWWIIQSREDQSKGYQWTQEKEGSEAQNVGVQTAPPEWQSLEYAL